MTLVLTNISLLRSKLSSLLRSGISVVGTCSCHRHGHAHLVANGRSRAHQRSCHLGSLFILGHIDTRMPASSPVQIDRLVAVHFANTPDCGTNVALWLDGLASWRTGQFFRLLEDSNFSWHPSLTHPPRTIYSSFFAHHFPTFSLC